MLKKLITVALALLMVQFLPIISFSNVIAFVLSVIVLTIFIYLIEPVLRLFSLPLAVATFGLFRIVLLVGSIWLTTFLIPGFSIFPMIFFGVKVHYIYTLIFVSVLFRGVHGFISAIIRS